MENWLVIGDGGREYAIAEALAKNSQRHVFVAPGNPMMNRIKNVETVPISVMAFDQLIQFVKQHQVAWTVVGPEDPLADGIVDTFRAHHLHIFGPTKAAAQLESSKVYAKKIMAKQGVKTAQYHEFFTEKDANAFLKKQNTFPIVIKANGLAAGKGVSIPQDLTTAIADVHRDFTMSPDSKILIEDYMAGQEFSLFTMVNGTQIIPMPLAQDHKRVGNGDKGPNTGGMGSYSPLPQFPKDLAKQTIKDVVMPVLTEMKKLGHPFTGFLYSGLMQTKSGTKVVEFNVRMGDPETQVVLPQLKSDLGDLIKALMLHPESHPQAEWDHDGYYLGTMLASQGYPGHPVDGKKLPVFNDPQLHVVYSGVKKQGSQLVSDGGRIMMVITHDHSIKQAQARINAAIKANVDHHDYEYRTDIGSKAFKN